MDEHKRDPHFSCATLVELPLRKENPKYVTYISYLLVMIRIIAD